jgi:hypothetical protein
MSFRARLTRTLLWISVLAWGILIGGKLSMGGARREARHRGCQGVVWALIDRGPSGGPNSSTRRPWPCTMSIRSLSRALAERLQWTGTRPVARPRTLQRCG